MSGTNKGITWTSESHEALILSFFNVTKPLSVEKQTAVAEAMNERGYKVSWEAIRQHLSKLRAKENNGNDAANAGSSVPATPKKAGGKGAKATPRGATTTGKRKAKKKALRDDLDDDDDDDIVDDDETPTKKVKKEMLIDADQENDNAKLAKSLFGNHDNIHDDEV